MSTSGEIVFRPQLWRYAAFRAAVIASACLAALAAVWLMRSLGMTVPRLGWVELAIVGCAYWLLDVLYARSDRRRVSLKLSSAGITVTRGFLGDVTIPWRELDWPRSQRRGFLDRLLGQSYLYGQNGQRILWQRIAMAPADVQAILTECALHAAQQ